MSSIRDYADISNLEDQATSFLVKRLKHLLYIKGEVEGELSNIIDMIEDIIVEMEEAGIDIDTIFDS